MHSLIRSVVYYCLPIAILLGVFIVHVNSRATTPSDSVWTIPLAASLLHEGNSDLNEYAPQFLQDDYRLDHLPTGVYYRFPIGTSLLVIPFLWGIERIAPTWLAIDDLPAYLRQHPTDEVSGRIERLLSSWFVAITAVVIYFIGRRQLNWAQSLVLVFIFAFCTPAWSTASRALWQHSASMLLLALTLWLLLKAEDAAPYAALAALPLALAYLVRPTNSLSVLLLTLFVLTRYPRQFLYFCGWGLLIGIPFLAYNFSLYAAPLSGYYRPTRLAIQGDFFQILAANLVSPGRGLFIWSPILLFALLGMGQTFPPAATSKGTSARRRLAWALIAIILLHWLTVSSFEHWWGGWSVGPRFFTDMLPYFVYFLIPVVQGLVNFPARSKVLNLLGLALFGLALAFSAFVHFHSAMHFNVFRWNRTPVNVDQYPGRVWDWNDIPFLRGLGPIMLVITPQASAASNPPGIVLEVSNQDSHLIDLTVKLPADFAFEATPLFQQQFQIVTKNADSTIARTQQSVAMSNTRTVPLLYALAPSSQPQCETPPIEIIATGADLWFPRRTAVIILPCQVDQPRDTLLEWLAGK